ncbi:hypothetical protein [Taibaiella chishuiensis]|uniref:Uncharacterized protein n=1 Tax=Taibaiella chishuiensis TaxID=1434707 RepID=A0A2P8D9X9_9BACT|nr:hypothetical protein [Taibaiella chishuiensis]PSK94030.1 hypothetical protein B0I18_101180 [Taibaiella chishuiensis]
MINSTNIRGYINFLHFKKYSAPATEELQRRWAILSDAEIASQLQGLYQHWGIDTTTGLLYEQEFYQAVAPLSSATLQQPQQAQQQAPQPQQTPLPPPPAYDYAAPQARSNKTVLYVGIIVLLALAGAFAFYTTNKKPDNTTTAQKPDTAKTAPAPVKQTATEPEEPVLAETETDEVNKGVIHNLLKAEESKDIGAILDCFSPDMQQYWDINYPSQEELTRRYTSVWDKSADGKHQRVRLKKTGDNTYDMYADYEFFSIKDQVTKTVKAHVRYVFDKYNKIIKTYNVK